MKDMKIALGLLGIILFILGAVINLLIYIKLKKIGIKNVFAYAKTNPDKVKNAKKWGYVSSIGFWIMLTAFYINS